MRITPQFIEKVYPVEERRIADGVQAIYQFPNGYGASVIRHSLSYGGPAGLWEVAVLFKGSICYDTSITSDVIGHLSEANVGKTLAEIQALPMPVNDRHGSIHGSVDGKVSGKRR